MQNKMNDDYDNNIGSGRLTPRSGRDVLGSVFLVPQNIAVVGTL